MRVQPGANRSAATPHRTAQPSAATVPCDLCGWPFQLPQHCIEQGAILGLLVCTQCTEDELQARTQ